MEEGNRKKPGRGGQEKKSEGKQKTPKKGIQIKVGGKKFSRY